jgi:hypothetical protein
MMRHRLLIVLLGTTLGACSVLFAEDGTQCAVDADCPSPSADGNVTPLVCLDGICVVETPGGGTGGGGGGDAGGGGGTMTDDLPFVVDSSYTPSGYMGDAIPGNVVETACPERAGEQRGSCHGFVYTKPATGSMNFGGVYWQYPANNWGEAPGYAMPQGAVAVTFYAWSDTDGLGAIFQAGINAADHFEVKTSTTTLGTSPKRFVVDLMGASYDEVAGAFAWSTQAPVGESHTIYIDDIVWVSEYPDVDVTFRLELPEPPAAGCAVRVYGTFDDWDINAVTMTDPEEDGIYTAKVPLPAHADTEYLFATKCGATENVEALPVDSSCTRTTDEFTNRLVTPGVTDLTLSPVCFGSCTPCP